MTNPESAPTSLLRWHRARAMRALQSLRK